jgi:hypothetical protein
MIESTIRIWTHLPLNLDAAPAEKRSNRGATPSVAGLIEFSEFSGRAPRALWGVNAPLRRAGTLIASAVI